MTARPLVEFSSVLIVQFLDVDVVFEEISFYFLFYFSFFFFLKPIKSSEKNIQQCVASVYFYAILSQIVLIVKGI